MILRGFGTVNSPLCTDVSPKAKEKHKACNFRDLLGRKPPELRQISSASKCCSPPASRLVSDFFPSLIWYFVFWNRQYVFIPAIVDLYLDSFGQTARTFLKFRVEAVCCTATCKLITLSVGLFKVKSPQCLHPTLQPPYHLRFS